MRLDKYLQIKYPEYSRTDLQKIIADGCVQLNGKPLAKNFQVNGDVECFACGEPELADRSDANLEETAIKILQLPKKEESLIIPENIPLNIVYEDDHLAVINKPRNMVMHPGNGIRGKTLAAALMWHFQNLSKVNGALRPGILHRLDKDTPGLLVVAKNDFAHRELSRQLEERTLERTYRAVIWGILRDREGKVDAPIDRDPRNRLKMSVQKDGKSAITNYKTLETFSICSLVEWKLDTGRTHQIRVHSRYLGNPVVGDPLYDGREESARRADAIYKPIADKLLEIAPSQLLQSYKMKFLHPETGKEMFFEIEEDDVMKNALNFLRAEANLTESVYGGIYAGGALQFFEPPQIFTNPEDVEVQEEEVEEEPAKIRPTRAERYAAAKIRRALKKERDRIRREEKEASEIAAQNQLSQNPPPQSQQ